MAADGVQLVATHQSIKVVQAAQDLVLHIVALVLLMQAAVAVALNKAAQAQEVPVVAAAVLIGILVQTELLTLVAGAVEVVYS